MPISLLAQIVKLLGEINYCSPPTIFEFVQYQHDSLRNHSEFEFSSLPAIPEEYFATLIKS